MEDTEQPSSHITTDILIPRVNKTRHLQFHADSGSDNPTPSTTTVVAVQGRVAGTSVYSYT